MEINLWSSPEKQALGRACEKFPSIAEGCDNPGMSSYGENEGRGSRVDVGVRMSTFPTLGSRSAPPYTLFYRVFTFL